MSCRGLLCLALVGCGPQLAWEEPELRSRACGTDEPIRLGERSGYSVIELGEYWGVSVAAEVGDDGFVSVFDTQRVDPCGGGVQDVIEGWWARPFENGWFACADAIVWSRDLDATPRPLPVGVQPRVCPVLPSDHGLVVLDMVADRLLGFAEPDAEPLLLQGDADVRRVAVAGMHAWVADDEAVHRVDLRTAERQRVGDGASSLNASPWGDAVAWSDGRVHPFVSWVQDSARDEITQVPGLAVGFAEDRVITWERASLHVFQVSRGHVVHFDVQTGSSHSRVVRSDADDVFLLVEVFSEPEHHLVVHLDMRSGKASTMRLGKRVYAQSDPHAAGILVFEADADGEDWSVPRGRLLRVGPSVSRRVLADDVSWSYEVAADGRILYTAPVAHRAEGLEVRVRNPDGSDRLVVDDAALLHGGPFGALAPRPPHAIDLEGDVLFGVSEASPSGGLWRMPFHEPPQ